MPAVQNQYKFSNLEVQAKAFQEIRANLPSGGTGVSSEHYRIVIWTDCLNPGQAASICIKYGGEPF
jgi:hypothetical protein